VSIDEGSVVNLISAMGQQNEYVKELGAERDELLEALRTELKRQFYGEQCSRCLGTWERHVSVWTNAVGGREPCPLTALCALVDRLDAADAE